MLRAVVARMLKIVSPSCEPSRCGPSTCGEEQDLKRPGGKTKLCEGDCHGK